MSGYTDSSQDSKSLHTSCHNGRCCRKIIVLLEYDNVLIAVTLFKKVLISELTLFLYQEFLSTIRPVARRVVKGGHMTLSNNKEHSDNKSSQLQILESLSDCQFATVYIQIW